MLFNLLATCYLKLSYFVLRVKNITLYNYVIVFYIFFWFSNDLILTGKLYILDLYNIIYYYTYIFF